MLFQAMREFERMREWMDGLSEGLARNVTGGVGYELNNLFENDGGYMLQFLAPGAKLEDISVGFENGVLSVSVKRKGASPVDGKGALVRSERFDYDFTRSWKLSGNIDAEKIEARLTDGMLLVSVPKKPGAELKKIAVKVA